jgi:hypothetical protein
VKLPPCWTLEIVAGGFRHNGVAAPSRSTACGTGTTYRSNVVGEDEKIDDEDAGHGDTPVAPICAIP